MVPEPVEGLVEEAPAETPAAPEDDFFINDNVLPDNLDLPDDPDIPDLSNLDEMIKNAGL